MARAVAERRTGRNCSRGQSVVFPYGGHRVIRGRGFADGRRGRAARRDRQRAPADQVLPGEDASARRSAARPRAWINRPGPVLIVGVASRIKEVGSTRSFPGRLPAVRPDADAVLELPRERMCRPRRSSPTASTRGVPRSGDSSHERHYVRSASGGRAPGRPVQSGAHERVRGRGGAARIDWRLWRSRVRGAGADARIRRPSGVWRTAVAVDRVGALARGPHRRRRRRRGAGRHPDTGACDRQRAVPRAALAQRSVMRRDDDGS